MNHRILLDRAGVEWTPIKNVSLTPAPNNHEPIEDNCAAVAAIQFAFETDEGMEFLRCWNHGDFDALRNEWPEAPEAVFIGADPLYKPAH